MLTGWDNKPSKYEMLSLCTYGTDTAILKQLVAEAIDYSEEKEDNLMKIYQVSRWGGDWHLSQKKKPKPKESVVLDSNIA